MQIHQDKTQHHNIKIGNVYEHYKGKQYRVLNIARHTDDLSWVVVYECLYENPVSQLWVRPLDKFVQNVTIDGSSILRFRHVGQK